MCCNRFDPFTEQWSSIPEMFVSRAEATAVAIDHQIYVLGGLGLNNEQLKTVECYNTKTMQWHKCADILQTRFNCGVSVV